MKYARSGWLVVSPAIFLLYSLDPVAPVRAGNPAVGDADISVAGVPVHSGSSDEVRVYLQQKLTPKLDRKVVLTDGVRTVVRSRGELGYALISTA